MTDCKPPTHSKVVAVSGDHLLIRLATPNAMRLGDRASIHRLLEVIPDPYESGRIMDAVLVRVGGVFITGIDSRFAMGNFEGPLSVACGDVVG